MARLTISEENRRRLLRIAGDLQRETGRRISFDDVISYLAESYEKRAQNKELFRLFCEPVERVDFDGSYFELIAERRRDEEIPDIV